MSGPDPFCIGSVVGERLAALRPDERIVVPRRQFLGPVAWVVAEAPRLAAGDLQLDRDPVVLDSDQVVRRVRESTRPERGDRALVDDVHPGHGPHVRDVAMAGQDEIDAQLAQERDHVAGVEHLVPLTAGARDRHQVVVAHEDP